MEFLHIIIIVLVLINIYLVYKTSYIEKLSAELPSVEHFESSNLSSGVNDQYTSDINDIKYLSSLAQRIISEQDTLGIISKKINFTNVKMEGNLKVSGNLVVDGTVEFTNKNKLNIDIIPRYMIVAWGGDETKIPFGWTICDGQRYKLNDDGTISPDSLGYKTPDLRGRFIISTGITKDNNNNPMTERLFGATGGVESVTLKSTQLPAHAHELKSGPLNSGLLGWTSHGYLYNSRGGDGIVTDTKGGGANGITDGHNNMPPYYVLVYIMKL
jgi:microcystin-dependent protein